LTGFNTVVREGLEVPGGVAVTANADLKVGALEENHHGVRDRHRWLTSRRRRARPY
jgi:hypothetical protein